MDMGPDHADRRSNEGVDDDLAPSGLPQRDLMLVTSAKYEEEKRIPGCIREFGIYYGDRFCKTQTKVSGWLKTTKQQGQA